MNRQDKRLWHYVKAADITLVDDDGVPVHSKRVGVDMDMREGDTLTITYQIVIEEGKAR